MFRCTVVVAECDASIQLVASAPTHHAGTSCPHRECSTHPSDRGHQMMAEALAGPLGRAVAEEAAAAAGVVQRSRRDDPRLAGLPPPMIPGNTESPTTVCAMQVRAGGGRGGWVG